MISEGQARALLEECERAVGRPLNKLRAQLAKSSDTLAALWELVTLHAALPLGEGVDHEPRDGCPDIVIDSAHVGRFWLEATHIGWPEREASARIRAFIDWVHRELRTKCDIEPTTYRLHCDPVSGDHDVGIPPQNAWAGLRAAPEWRDFVRRMQSGDELTIVTDLVGAFSVRLTAERYARAQNTISSGYRSPKVVTKISEHPVWTAIRSKGIQASAWKLEHPIVVCIGSSLSYSLRKSAMSTGPTAEAAVLGALYDTPKWGMISQYNRLRDTSRTRYTVKGATRISAVLLVSIEEPVRLGLARSNYCRVAKATLYLNECARHPLSQQQLQLLRRINFNQFPYGPQWETWPDLSRSDWKRETRIAERREPGKMVRFAPRRDGSFELDIPAEDLVKVLAGVEGIESLRDSIKGLHADHALSRVPPLHRVEVIPGKPKAARAGHAEVDVPCAAASHCPGGPCGPNGGRRRAGTRARATHRSDAALDVSSVVQPARAGTNRGTLR